VGSSRCTLEHRAYLTLVQMSQGLAASLNSASARPFTNHKPTGNVFKPRTPHAVPCPSCRQRSQLLGPRPLFISDVVIPPSSISRQNIVLVAQIAEGQAAASSAATGSSAYFRSWCRICRRYGHSSTVARKGPLVELRLLRAYDGATFLQAPPHV
jgi:hypothetical protein